MILLNDIGKSLQRCLQNALDFSINKCFQRDLSRNIGHNRDCVKTNRDPQGYNLHTKNMHLLQNISINKNFEHEQIFGKTILPMNELKLNCKSVKLKHVFTYQRLI